MLHSASLTQLLQLATASRPVSKALADSATPVGATRVYVGAHEYDSSMSDRKARLTITVDSHLSSYAEHLVASGHATSVSAAFNEAMAEKAYRDRRLAQPMESEK